MPSTKERSSIEERISSGIILCQKNHSIYPRSHPRVQASLRALQVDLEQFRRETGGSFSMESSELEEPSPSQGPRSAPGKGSRELSALRGLLKASLIEKVLILPGVTEDELFGLCLLLDPSPSLKARQVGREIDPMGWSHIRLSFYEPRDFTVDETAGGALLEQAAGVHLAGNLDPLLEQFKPETRQSIRKAFLHPAILRRISELRHALLKSLPPQEKGVPTRKIDLIGEIARMAVPALKSEGQAELKDEDVLSTLDGYVGFIEKNFESLVNEIRSFADVGKDALEMNVLERIQVIPGLADQLGRFQVQKHRLAFLFRTAAGKAAPQAEPAPEVPASQPGSPAPVHPAAASFPPAASAGSKPAGGPVSGPFRPAEPENQVPLRERFQDVHYDPRSFEMAIRNGEAEREYLQIILHLLGREDRSEDLRQRIPAMVATVGQWAREPGIFDDALREVLEAWAWTRSPALEELLYSLLAQMDRDQDLPRILEEVVLDRGGAGLVEGFLGWISAKDGRRAIVLLSRWRREAGPALRKLSAPRLLSLAENRSLLAVWACGDPDGFFCAEMFRDVLGRIPAGAIQDAFRELFANAGGDLAGRLFNVLPAGSQASERILFSAIDQGSPMVRNLALGSLWKHPSPTVISALMEILNRNNFRGHFRVDEVAAVLTSLSRIPDPRVSVFLDEVLRKRRWLGFAYLGEIRKALAAIQCPKGNGP